MIPVTFQYAVCAIGVFGPLGQNATFYPTEVEARTAAAKGVRGEQAPIFRKRIRYQDEEFFTEWQHLAKTVDEIANYKPKGMTEAIIGKF